MSWLLSSIVGSSKPALSFNLGEAYSGDAWGAWTHYRGTSKARGSRSAAVRYAAAYSSCCARAGFSARGRVGFQDHWRQRKRP